MATARVRKAQANCGTRQRPLEGTGVENSCLSGRSALVAIDSISRCELRYAVVWSTAIRGSPYQDSPLGVLVRWRCGPTRRHDITPPPVMVSCGNRASLETAVAPLVSPARRRGPKDAVALVPARIWPVSGLKTASGENPIESTLNAV